MIQIVQDVGTVRYVHDLYVFLTKICGLFNKSLPVVEAQQLSKVSLLIAANRKIYNDCLHGIHIYVPSTIFSHEPKRGSSQESKPGYGTGQLLQHCL
jgi:hypothetical protein